MSAKMYTILYMYLQATSFNLIFPDLSDPSINLSLQLLASAHNCIRSNIIALTIHKLIIENETKAAILNGSSLANYVSLKSPKRRLIQWLQFKWSKNSSIFNWLVFLLICLCQNLRMCFLVLSHQHKQLKYSRLQ